MSWESRTFICVARIMWIKIFFAWINILLRPKLLRGLCRRNMFFSWVNFGCFFPVGSIFLTWCNGFTWVKLFLSGSKIFSVGQHFAWVKVLTWVAWVKDIFCVGQFFLRWSNFLMWVKLLCGSKFFWCGTMVLGWSSFF